MAVIRTNVSRSPQFARPLMPHICALDRSWPAAISTQRVGRHLRFVQFCFNVKALNRLKSAVNQPWDAIQKAEPKHTTIEEKPYGPSRQLEELLLQPPSPLCL